MSSVTVLIIIFICLFIYKLFSPGRKILNYGNRIPGPKAYPILGSGLCFFTQKTFLQVIYDFSKTYGSVFRLWFGRQLFVVLSDPADVEVFLTSTTKHLDKSDSYRFLDSWLGNTNLLTSDGDIWQVHRKALTPSFHFKFLENSVDMITENADVLIDQLQKLLDQKDFDIEPYVEKFSLDIICETAMGIKLETQLSKNTIYLDSIKTVTEIIVKRTFYPWLHPEPIFRITPLGLLYYKRLKVIKAEGQKMRSPANALFCLGTYHQSLTKIIVKRAASPWLHPDIIFRLSSIGQSYDRAVQSAKCFVAKVINLRRKMMKDSDLMLPPSEQAGKKASQPLLDFLLTRSSFSDAEIENEVQAFMFAGHDTTKTTISFCLYSLSQNEDVQNKLLEEINSIFVDKQGQPSYQDYVNMKYLDCVIKETMRLYATVPFISRKVNEDIQLPSGYKLPSGALVNFFIFSIHRNEHLYSDPEKFLPQRFENRDSKRTPFAFIPFSAGSRNCIGQKLAMIEMKIVISKLLLKYQFLPAIESKPLVLDTCLILHSVNGLPVRIKQRL